MATEVSAEKLVEVGAHFGHQMKRWNPKMKDYMYKVQDGTFIFDLIKTKSYLTSALEEITQASRAGKSILFVGTKKQIKDKLVEVAKETNSFYISERWLGGIFTNFAQVKQSLSKMIDMKEKLSKGQFGNYTKKERLIINREIEKTQRMIGGLVGMDKVPDLMFIIDTHKEGTAVSEARRLKVPIAGIVDSNGDPDIIDFPIPMNDDATLAVSYILDLVKEAILEGKSKPAAKAEKAEVKEKKEKAPKKEKKVKKEETK